MKLLCKKSHYSTVLMITLGKYYTFDTTFAYYITKDDVGNIWYFLSPGIEFVGNVNWPLYIWDYFYTPQEERKMKLERIGF